MPTRLLRGDCGGGQHPLVLRGPTLENSKRPSGFVLRDSDGCSAGQAGQVESALGLWRQMAASGTPPSVDNCNALLNACIDCGNGERALDIYRSMQDLGACHSPQSLYGHDAMSTVGAC